MSIFETIFGAKPNTTVAANQQVSSANQNATVPNAVNTPPAVDPAGTAVPSPLDGYTDLWQTPAAGTDPNAPMFNVDPAKLQAAAAKIDFGKVINPADLKAIAGGGDAAMVAFQSALVNVAQATFAQSTATTAKLIEQAMKTNNTNLNTRIPGMIKSQNISDLNRADNPLFSNPATAPIMNALEQQFQAKYPTATAAEITAHTKSYLTDFVTLANAPAAAAAATKASKGEPDWSGFLD
jgi:hypothetical protein